MKNKLILGAAFLMAAITESLACTNLIVGKGASVDGSVIVLIPLIHTECLASYIIILRVCMKKEPCVISMIGIRANIYGK